MTRIASPTLCIVLSSLTLAAVVPCAAAAPSPPATASPGDPQVFAAVAGPCPTFSWGAVANADHYELALYAFDGEGRVEARPRLPERRPGSVTAWTPVLGRCPEPGRRYAWSVRALVGGAETDWSESRFFLLADAPPVSQVAAALDRLSLNVDAEKPVNKGGSEPEAPAAETSSSAAPAPARSGSGEAGAFPPSHPPTGVLQPVVEPEPHPGSPAQPTVQGAVEGAAKGAVVGPALVLANGGIQFPDGSLQTKAAWNEPGLISMRVTGSTLKPRENDVSYTVNSNGSCVYATAGDASTVWNAAVHLPQGATVDTLRMYYFDTSASNMTAWFTVYDLYGSIVQEWSVSSSGNSGNSFQDSTQINHVIDDSVYNYVLNWRPVVASSTLQLCGFRIFYAR